MVAVMERSRVVSGGYTKRTFEYTRPVLRGDVYMADLGEGNGHVQGGNRPVLVLQNNVGNRFSPTVIVAMISSQIHKAKLPTHVILPKELGFDRESYAMLEQIQCINKKDLGTYITHLDNNVMKQIENAALVSIGIGM